MGQPIPVKGARGLIKWEYHTAARLEHFTATPDEARIDGLWSLEAKVTFTDPYCLGRKPLVFTTALKLGRWQWEILEFTLVNGGRLTARLGPLEVR